MAYNAVITRIATRPHPNADKIQIGTCCGCQVIIGLDTVDGEVGAFFPTDGQLSHEFCLENNLYSRSALEKLGMAYDENTKVGFFSEKRRVRAQSFRGVKSDGFWVPLSYLEYASSNVASLPEGTEFDTLEGIPVCNKYITQATRNASGKIGRKQRENRCFPKHDVSKKWKFVNRTIPDGAVCWITEKLHGTSGRYGLVLDETPFETLPWWTRLQCHITRTYPQPVYRYLNGSKNVILEKSSGGGWYGSNEFRYKAIEGVTLHKGEILYFEIVGYVPETGRAIMDPHPIKDDLKDLRKTYGEKMTYKYGLDEAKCDIYIYKIVRINEDGQAIDLSWLQVTSRAKELGLKTVPQLCAPFIHDTLKQTDDPLSTDAMVELLTEGVSTLDSTHIREGVVLRVESVEGVDYIKNKSWTFGVLEGYIKDNDSYVDTEEAS